MPATHVYRLLKDSGFRVLPDGSWELRTSYKITGPDTELDCYGAVDATSGLVFPEKGTDYPTNDKLHANEVQADFENKNAEVGNVWLGRVIWRSAGPVEAIVDTTRWNWEPSLNSEAVDCDAEGNPFLNSAGDHFGTIPDDITMLLLKVRRTEPFYDPATGYTFTGAVNASPMNLFGTLSIDAGQMRCLYYKPLSEQQFGSPSVLNEYAFEFRNGFEPFQPRAIDKGLNGWYADPTSGEARRGAFCAKPNKDPWGDQILLDGIGKPFEPDKFQVAQISEGGKITLRDAIANPHVPPGAVHDPSINASVAVGLVFRRKRQINFQGLIAGIM